MMTKKRATKGKVVKLHKYWKGVAANILDKQSRRNYLNLMLDATVSEHEAKTRKTKEKDEE